MTRNVRLINYGIPESPAYAVEQVPATKSFGSYSGQNELVLRNVDLDVVAAVDRLAIELTKNNSQR